MKLRYTNKSLHYLDFDLIEGITYNIVHSMSEKNLVNVDERVQVGAPNESDPNQH
ncbi:hypothetical protein RhiirA1_466274 [Rhizophagus irregularis]|uniref:Uncharacterized protein n=1 Tax=Rhizophagus irregularis TaxID=588596 RepID=A0A2N0RE88_9GLOM|nr:hypothetical protein RhiirA1_466274 [Rhizophagus irregularis]